MRMVVRRAAIQALLSGCSIFALSASSGIARADQPLLIPNSLVISSSTYDPTMGAVASLAIGTTLPNSATATTTAVAGNDYVNVWNNASVDGSFGVTSADPVDRHRAAQRPRVQHVRGTGRSGGHELLLQVGA